MSSSSRKINLVKNSRGDMRFERCEPSGAKVTIKNNGMKNINMKGWVLKKIVNGMDKGSFTFGDYSASSGKEVTIVAKGAESELEYGELLGDMYTWGSTGKFVLMDDKNTEKASMDVQMI